MLLFAWTLFFLHIDTYAASGNTTRIHFIHYLKQLGVEKLDFYIATHAHSDHIGSGDEIMEHFPVDCLYIAEYDDSYQLAAHGKDVTDPYYCEDADEDTLWDNQYVYDRIIQAA